MISAVFILGVMVILRGFTAPTVIDFYGISVSTTSLGFAILALDVALLLGLTFIAMRAGGKGVPEYPYYDPPRFGERAPKWVVCPDCRRDYSNSLTECPHCHHKRPLY